MAYFLQKHKEELHTAKISLIIVVLFLACWMPFHVTNLLLRVHWITIHDLPPWFLCLIHVLVVVYPSLSPCIFAFRCKKLQRELRKMMGSKTSTAGLPALSPKSSRNTDFSRFSLPVPPLVRKSGIIVQNQFTLHRDTTTNIPKSSSQDINFKKCSS